jgi:hypothetical protein
MRDITDDTLIWVACCRDVWEKWFANLENGDDEFFEVEDALFSSLVLSKLELKNRPNLNECKNFLRAVYKRDISEMKSVCRKQPSGNIFCTSEMIDQKKGQEFSVKSIDVNGTMLDGSAYAEVQISKTEFVLEDLDNLHLKFLDGEVRVELR